MPPLLIVLTGLPHGCRTARRSSSSVGSTPTDRDRQRWQDFATGRGMQHELVYLAADQSLLDTRRATAAATPDRHVLSTDVLQRVQRRFQPPAIATHTINANWPTPQQLQTTTTNWPNPEAE